MAYHVIYLGPYFHVHFSRKRAFCYIVPSILVLVYSFYQLYRFAVLFQVFWSWFTVLCTSYVSWLIFCVVVLSITGSEELKSPSVIIELFLILISSGIFIHHATPLFCAWIFTLLYLIDELILYHYILFLLASYNNFWVKVYFF